MLSLSPLGQEMGQTWQQVYELAVAFGLSALIGIERQVRQKSAGIRTYTVVGLGSALFMIVSKFGFMDVVSPGRVEVDPSRVAAQIVSGLGFIGAGIIFTRRESVRGLTTAASIWMTAAIAAAAGAGLIVMAASTTAAYFLSVLVLSPLARSLSRGILGGPPTLTLEYLDGRGLLRTIMTTVTESGYQITELRTDRRPEKDDSRGSEAVVTAVMVLRGNANVSRLAGHLADIPGVVKVGDEPGGDED